MTTIAIDTSSLRLTLALIVGDKRYYHTENVGKSGHSRLLMQRVNALIKAAGIDVEDIDCVACVTGPGSFTGIRIGVSCATALAFANGAKRISVTSFELLAYDRGRVKVAVDAGHGNWYVAECDGGKALSADFVEGGNADGCIVEREDPARLLAAVAEEKISAGEFTDVLEPYYMRRSQAEREKDEIR